MTLEQLEKLAQQAVRQLPPLSATSCQRCGDVFDADTCCDDGRLCHDCSHIAAEQLGEGVFALLFERARLLERIAEIEAKLNTPHTANFIEAACIEAAHQVARWGVEHDAGKRPEDWIALVVYLTGKATKAHYDADREKLIHHIITIAAACANWHANAIGADTRMRPGVAERRP